MHAGPLQPSKAQEGSTPDEARPQYPPEPSGYLFLLAPNSSAFAVALMQHADELVVSCTPTDTITQVLEKMDLKAVHRVWIVDEAGRPTGVISLADVLAVVSRIGMDAEEFEKSRAKMMVA